MLILLVSSWWRDESLAAVKKCCCAAIVGFTIPTVRGFFFLMTVCKFSLASWMQEPSWLSLLANLPTERIFWSGCVLIWGSFHPLDGMWLVTVLAFETFIIDFESNLKEAAWFVGLVYYFWEFGVLFALVFCHFSRGSLTLLLSCLCSGNSNILVWGLDRNDWE